MDFSAADVAAGAPKPGFVPCNSVTQGPKGAPPLALPLVCASWHSLLPWQTVIFNLLDISGIYTRYVIGHSLRFTTCSVVGRLNVKTCYRLPELADEAPPA